MKKYQLEFTFKDDHVRRHGCSRMSHNDRNEAEKMLQKAMEMTVKNGVIVKLYEIGEDQPDEHFPRNHVRIEIGIGGGGTCTSQIAKVRLEDEVGLTP